MSAGSMMRRLRLLTVFSLLYAFIASTAWSTETPLPVAQNLIEHATTAQKQQGAPLILLVSLSGCAFCEHIRKQHLATLANTGAMVRQIYVDSDAPLIDFDDKPTTQRQFAKKLAIKVAPTVFFFDMKGTQLAEPIVGTLLDDFYGAYLDDAILASRKKLVVTH
jgi:thioredoxin-related protein